MDETEKTSALTDSAAIPEPSPSGEGGESSGPDEGYREAERTESPSASSAPAPLTASLGVRRFAERFPDVEAKDIPREVWDEVLNGENLVAAYALHENARLRAELEALRASQSAKERALPGSATAGGGHGRDAFIEGFMEK